MIKHGAFPFILLLTRASGGREEGGGKYYYIGVFSRLSLRVGLLISTRKVKMKLSREPQGLSRDDTKQTTQDPKSKRALACSVLFPYFFGIVASVC